MEPKELMEIGLTEGEAKAYLALNKIGQSTVGPIIDESGISRSKIYDVLERLIQKGLVSYITKDKTKYFQANEPGKIKDYLEEKEKKIKENKEKIEKLIPFLDKERLEGKSPSSIQVYEGFNGIMAAHDHLFLRLKRNEEYFFLGIPAFQEERYHEYWKEAHKRRVKAGIKCRLLFNKKTPRSVMIDRNSYKGSDARYMPIEIETPAWVMGYKDVTIIGLQAKKGMAIEIINREIAESFKNYFDVMWKISKHFK